MDVDPQMMAALLQPGVLAKMLQEQQKKMQLPDSNPNINIPVEVVPDPIQVRGTLELDITVPYDLAIKPYDEVLAAVYDVIQNRTNEPWSPFVRYGGLTLRRVVYASQVPGANPGADRTPVAGGVPQAGHYDDSTNAWDSEPGTANPGIPGNAAGPVDPVSLHNNIARLIQSASHGDAEGGGGVGDSGSGESWLSESGWDALEQTGPEAAREEGGPGGADDGGDE